MTVKDSQEDMEAVFRRLHKIAHTRQRRLSFFEACDFIAAMSGMRLSEVMKRLIDVEEPGPNDVVVFPKSEA